MVIPYPTDKKKCSACDEWKTVPDEYYMRKRYRVNGDIAMCPTAKCKKCSSAVAKVRVEKWREKKRESGELSEFQRRWHKNREPGSRRVYNKEYKAMKRREQGIKPRTMKPSSIKSSVMVPIGPFQEWVTKKISEYRLDFASAEGSTEILAEICGVSNRLLSRVMRGTEYVKGGGARTLTQIPLDTVDKCLTNEGSTGLWELYPSLFEDDLVAN